MAITRCSYQAQLQQCAGTASCCRVCHPNFWLAELSFGIALQDGKRMASRRVTTGCLGIGIGKGIGIGLGSGKASPTPRRSLLSDDFSSSLKQRTSGEHSEEEEPGEMDLSGERPETGDPFAPAHSSPKSFLFGEKELIPLSRQAAILPSNQEDRYRAETPVPL